MRKFKLLIGVATLSVMLATPLVSQARDKTRNTLIGVGIGMLGGAILSNGYPWATVAGGAAGGVVGNIATKDHRRDDRFQGRDRRDGRHNGYETNYGPDRGPYSGSRR